MLATTYLCLGPSKKKNHPALQLMVLDNSLFNTYHRIIQVRGNLGRSLGQPAQGRVSSEVSSSGLENLQGQRLQNLSGPQCMTVLRMKNILLISSQNSCFSLWAHDGQCKHHEEFASGLGQAGMIHPYATIGILCWHVKYFMLQGFTICLLPQKPLFYWQHYMLCCLGLGC